MKIGFSGSRVVSSDWMDGRADGQTDMTKVIDFFDIFLSTPKNGGVRFSRKTLPFHETTLTDDTEHLDSY